MISFLAVFRSTVPGEKAHAPTSTACRPGSFRGAHSDLCVCAATTSMYVCVCVFIYKIAHNRAIWPCHPSHSTPLVLALPRDINVLRDQLSMILITKPSDQTRQRGHTLSTCTVLTY